MERDLAREQLDLVCGVREAFLMAEHRRAAGNRFMVAAVAVIGLETAAIVFLWPHVAAWFSL